MYLITDMLVSDTSISQERELRQRRIAAVEIRGGRGGEWEVDLPCKVPFCHFPLFFAKAFLFLVLCFSKGRVLFHSLFEGRAGKTIGGAGGQGGRDHVGHARTLQALLSLGPDLKCTATAASSNASFQGTN